MHHDEAKITAGNLFTNPYNVTDTCNRSSCTLANRPFATIREYEGVFYLCMKANQQWGRLKLPRNYEKATQLINKQMMYWPPLLRQRVQYQLRMMTDMRKLAKKTRKEVKRKTRREEKAKKAAAAEKVTERELLQWLKERTYDPGSIVNPSIDASIKIIEKEEEKVKEVEIEYVEDEDERLEEDDMANSPYIIGKMMMLSLRK